MPTVTRKIIAAFFALLLGLFFSYIALGMLVFSCFENEKCKYDFGVARELIGIVAYILPIVFAVVGYFFYLPKVKKAVGLIIKIFTVICIIAIIGLLIISQL